MDILQLNAAQRAIKGAAFNEYFPRKPLFAFYSGTTSTNAMVDFFASCERRAMKTFMRGSSAPGTPPNFAHVGNQESAQGSYWGGNTSAGTSSNTFNITAGYTGLSAHSNTMLLNSLELTAEGISAFDGTQAACGNTIGSMGVVLGEEGYAQGIDLLKLGERLFIGQIGDQMLADKVNDPAVSLLWPNLVGLTRLSSGQNSGYGDIGYNRKSNTLAFIETRNGTDYTCRLHIFKNIPKLKANAYHLKTILEAAIAGQNGSSYETFDFTWNGSNNVEWHQGTRVIPCDDGTFWLARMNPSASLTLARIGFVGSTTTRTFNAVNSLGLTTTYGREQAGHYGIRHMVSENGKMVAVYCPYYYYNAGGMFFFLPRDSAATATRHLRHAYTDSAYGMSIAPCGKSSFVIGYANNQDQKVRDGRIIDLDNNPLTGSDITLGNFNYFNITGLAGSTMYNANGFVKVQDIVANTTEYKEAA